MTIFISYYKYENEKVFDCLVKDNKAQALRPVFNDGIIKN